MNLKNKLKGKKGFTLAEILVTLAIIGVVAALTIPTLMNSMTNSQYKAAYKKKFSELASTTLLIAQDNGGSLAGAFSSFEVMRDDYLEQIKSIKSCNKWHSVGECWPSNVKYLNGLTSSGGLVVTDLTEGGGFSGATLNDGSSIAFVAVDANCNSTSYLIGNICGYLLIDVNGFKQPNLWGKDIHSFIVKKEGQLLPTGIKNDQVWSNNITCGEGDTTAKNIGLNCAYLNYF